MIGCAMGRIPCLPWYAPPPTAAGWTRSLFFAGQEIGWAAGATLKYVHTDSWECGGMN